MLQKISFTSTYRIPLSEHRMKPNKKDTVKKFSDNFPNHLHSNNRRGWVRISVPEEQDQGIEQSLNDMGIKIYQKFPEHDVPIRKMNEYIKNALRLGQYEQIGKLKKRISPKAKYELRKLRIEQEQERLRQERLEASNF